MELRSQVFSYGMKTRASCSWAWRHPLGKYRIIGPVTAHDTPSYGAVLYCLFSMSFLTSMDIRREFNQAFRFASTASSPQKVNPFQRCRLSLPCSAIPPAAAGVVPRLRESTWTTRNVGLFSFGNFNLHVCAAHRLGSPCTMRKTTPETRVLRGN